MRYLNVNKTILIQFYRAVIESVLSNSILVWYSRATVYYKCRLQSVVRNAESLIGINLPSLESIYIQRMEKKTKKILNDAYHPGHIYFNLLPSGRRLRAFKGCKRFTNSFFPECVKHYNGTRVT